MNLYDVRTVNYLYDVRINPSTIPHRRIVVEAREAARSLTKSSAGKPRPSKPAGVPGSPFERVGTEQLSFDP